ncbi:DUF6125 family protein [Chloroflexota bacterium]
MTELAEYGGEFKPDIKYGDFSKEVLVKALKAFGEFTHKLDGIWYLAVQELMGNEKALACDMKVWERVLALRNEITARVFGIEGTDITAAMKVQQLHPLANVFDFELDIEDNNRAVITVTGCPSLVSLEREGEGREREICHMVEPNVFRHHAHFFDPKIEVRPLKQPPRNSPDEICCQWEFKLEA